MSWNIFKMLEGYRTYIVAATIGIVVALHVAGVLSDAAAESLLALLGAGGLAALRASRVPK